MKQIFKWFPMALAVLMACKTTHQVTSIEVCEDNNAIQFRDSKFEELKTSMRELVELGVPGIAMALITDEDTWEHSYGLASIENQTPMLPCHLHYLQSISKTYLATAILLMHEEGLIELDEPLDIYLPGAQSKLIQNASQITVRMLLNHTSGIPEYNLQPAYVTDLLQNPVKTFDPSDYLSLIKNKKPDFAPGSGFRYVNTNYEILALIGDHITGNHASYLQNRIFDPLSLEQTHYRSSQDYLEYNHLYHAYWDRYSDGILENVSEMQRNNVACMIGDDGIVSSPKDAVKFLRALLSGDIVTKSTLEHMKDWYHDENGKALYGLGLDHTEFADHEAYGHSGGGIGAGTQLYYLPHNNTYFFLGINMGTVTSGPIHNAALPKLAEIHELLVSL